MAKQEFRLGRLRASRMDYRTNETRHVSGDVVVTLDLEHPTLRRKANDALLSKGDRAVEVGGALVIRVIGREERIDKEKKDAEDLDAAN